MVTPNQAGPYEFGAREEAKIAQLAWRVRLWGIVALILGVLGILGFSIVWYVVAGSASTHRGLLISASVAAAPVVIVNTLIAALYIGAGNALRRVVDTQRNDVPHLLDGLSRLAGAFRIETILGSIGVVAAAIGLFAVIGD